MTEDVIKDLYINETDLMNLKNELAKEDTYTYKYEKGNTKLYIEITNVCNLNCSFCSKDNRVKKSLSKEEFEKIIINIYYI